MTYNVLKLVKRLTNKELHTTFVGWNEGKFTYVIFFINDDKIKGFFCQQNL